MESSPAETPRYPSQCAMNDDAERLVELRAKLLRICGHKEWSAKQGEAALELMRDIVEIEGADGVAELFSEGIETNAHRRPTSETESAQG
jgi:hypothetical protein